MISVLLYEPRNKYHVIHIKTQLYPPLGIIQLYKGAVMYAKILHFIDFHLNKNLIFRLHIFAFHS